MTAVTALIAFDKASGAVSPITIFPLGAHSSGVRCIAAPDTPAMPKSFAIKRGDPGMVNLRRVVFPTAKSAPGEFATEYKNLFRVVASCKSSTFIPFTTAFAPKRKAPLVVRLPPKRLPKNAAVL